MNRTHARKRAFIIGTLGLAATAGRAAADPSDLMRIAGHMPAALSQTKLIGATDESAPLSMAIVLPLRNPGLLQTTLQQIYDPSSPSYHHFLSSEEFNARFAPTEADYSAVAAYAKSQGLTVSGTHTNRLVLDVKGSALNASSAFHVRLNNYRAADGRVFHCPSSDPLLPASIAGRVQSIVGLDNAAVLHPNFIQTPINDVLGSPNYLQGMTGGGSLLAPRGGGSGPGGGLTPSDINTAYNLAGGARTGSGQTLALFELDGYSASDIRMYESAYGLPNVPLQNILVDGVNGVPATDGAAEVTLDIELQIAVAPGVSKVIVYEAPNTGSGLVDEYNRIATDNTAKQISTSWGMPEHYANAALLNAENTIFQQMAAQGQSIYAAAGDSGAYDDNSTVCVDDPASQPFVSSVGGTRLTLGANHSYGSETTWNHGRGAGAGGGGVSVYWNKPDWQQGLGVSATKRNIPDVSLDSDPNTGYSIAYHGSWTLFGGTSCASPLWAGFTALVNQQRAIAGLSPMGFPNPVLYTIGKGTNYGADFHDIADASTNLFYSATTGFDDATGWGTFNGLNLLADLAPMAPPVAPATDLAATLTPPTTVGLSWTAVDGAASYNVLRGTKAGGPYAKIGNTATASYTDTTAGSSTTYYYVVVSVVASGTSVYSNEASVTTAGAPQAITDLAAASAGMTGVNLTWTAGATATSYNILRSATHSGPYTQVGTSTDPSYSDTGLTGSTTYYYVVTAANSDGVSANSNEASATTAPAAPPAPTKLTATSAGSYRIVLSWTASLRATGYAVLRSTTAGGPYTAVTTSSTTSASNDGLAPGTTYYYVVTAINTGGTSPNSNEASAKTTPAAPQAPANLTATAASASAINLSWTAPAGAVSYNVLRGVKHLGPYSKIGTTTSTTYVSDSLDSSTAYYYVVTAVNTVGSSPNSNEATATTALGAPKAPTGLVAKTQNTTMIGLSWNPTPYATGYGLFRSTTKGGPYTSIGIVNVNSSNSAHPNCADSSLTPNTTYYYVINAFNSVGSGPNGAEANATTLPLPPSSATNLTATAVNASRITLSWTAGDGATGYIIQRSLTAGGPYTKVATATTTNYINDGLDSLTTYYYVVTSVNAGGTADNSNEASATTALAPPPVPAHLTATTTGTTSIALTWTASKNAASYTVSRRTGSTGAFTQIATTTDPAYANTGLTGSTTYTYIVTATNAAGVSLASAPASAITAPNAPPAPTHLVVSSVAYNHVNLAWTSAARATSYVVARSATQGGPYTQVGSATGVNYIDTSVSGSTTYYYVVSAANAGGGSDISNEVTATTPTAPPAGPTGLTARALGATQINLTWTASTDAVTYNVLRAKAHNGPYVKIATCSGTGYSDRGLTKATMFYYVVSATNTNGTGANSAEASAQTAAVVFAAPTGLATQPEAPTLMGLSWNAVPGATTYGIYRSTTQGGPYTSIGIVNVWSGNAAHPNCADAFVQAGTTYYYVVTAYTTGATSGFSNEAVGTTATDGSSANR